MFSQENKGRRRPAPHATCRVYQRRSRTFRSIKMGVRASELLVLPLRLPRLVSAASSAVHNFAHASLAILAGALHHSRDRLESNNNSNTTNRNYDRRTGISSAYDDRYPPELEGWMTKEEWSDCIGRINRWTAETLARRLYHRKQPQQYTCCTINSHRR